MSKILVAKKKQFSDGKFEMIEVNKTIMNIIYEIEKLSSQVDALVEEVFSDD